MIKPSASKWYWFKHIYWHSENSRAIISTLSSSIMINMNNNIGFIMLHGLSMKAISNLKPSVTSRQIRFRRKWVNENLHSKKPLPEQSLGNPTVYRTIAHLADVFLVIHIWWDFRFILVPISCCHVATIFAHATTAQLSCHVQNFVAICLLDFGVEWNEIFELRCENC